MKGFTRENQYLSLCGLNCALCPMQLGGHCGGCGKNSQSCSIARCSLDKKIAYCFECRNYPCERYQRIDEYDSFITHQNKQKDFNKAMIIGIENYNLEQKEKRVILDDLLVNYNDGRSKNFFCLAVNLLELSDLKEVLNQLHFSHESPKEKCLFIRNEFQKMADKKGIQLKLRKKSG